MEHTTWKINGWNMSKNGGLGQIIFLYKWVMAVGEPAVNLPGCNHDILSEDIILRSGF